MSRKRGLLDSEASAAGTDGASGGDGSERALIFRSAAVEDRASRFVAAFSPAANARSLQDINEFRSATHRIAAWRRAGSQRTLAGNRPLYETGYDDDGEKYAGKKLERLLISLDVVGAVVVARWYGGIMLGPQRFTHIENCARAAILEWRHSQARTVTSDHEPAHVRDHAQNKRAKTGQGVPTATTTTAADEQNVRLRLIQTLGERDESIKALRGLLAEKQTSTAAPTATSTASAQDASPHRALQYSSMSLEVLRRLERARDSTIAWILKKLDEAEEKQASDGKKSNAALEAEAASPARLDAQSADVLSKGDAAHGRDGNSIGGASTLHPATGSAFDRHADDRETPPQSPPAPPAPSEA